MDGRLVNSTNHPRRTLDIQEDWVIELGMEKRGGNSGFPRELAVKKSENQTGQISADGDLCCMFRTAACGGGGT